MDGSVSDQLLSKVCVVSMYVHSLELGRAYDLESSYKVGLRIRFWFLNTSQHFKIAAHRLDTCSEWFKESKTPSLPAIWALALFCYQLNRVYGLTRSVEYRTPGRPPCLCL
jgi:hypothetical protein